MKCVECFKRGKESVAIYSHFGKSLCGECLPESIKNGNELVNELDALRRGMSETNAKFAESMENLEIAMRSMRG